MPTTTIDLAVPDGAFTAEAFSDFGGLVWGGYADGLLELFRGGVAVQGRGGNNGAGFQDVTQLL